MGLQLNIGMISSQPLGGNKFPPTTIESPQTSSQDSNKGICL